MAAFHDGAASAAVVGAMMHSYFRHWLRLRHAAHMRERERADAGRPALHIIRQYTHCGMDNAAANTGHSPQRDKPRVVNFLHTHDRASSARQAFHGILS